MRGQIPNLINPHRIDATPPAARQHLGKACFLAGSKYFLAFPYLGLELYFNH